MDWKKIIGALRDAGFTQQQIAEHCGCTQSTVSELASGKIIDPRDSIGQALRELFTRTVKRAKH